MSGSTTDQTRQQRRAERERQQAQREAARKGDPVKYRANVAMQRLRDILDPTPPLWSAWQASWYLIGVVGDASEPRCGNEGPLHVWLPDAAASFNNDPDFREMEVDEAHDYVRGFCVGESRTPGEWLEHSLAKKHEPVWLKAALADAECRSFLPAKILKKFRVTADGEKRQANAARAMHANKEESKAIATLEPEFRVWFAQWPNGKMKWGALSEWSACMVVKLWDEQGVEVQKESIDAATLRWR